MSFFFAVSAALSVSWEGEYCMKGALGSVTHLPAMLPCSFEDHLSVASLKCFFTKASSGCSLWTRHRNCPWNKSEHSQEALRLASEQEEDVMWEINHKRERTTFVNSSVCMKKEKIKKWFAFFVPWPALCRYLFARFLALFTFQPGLITAHYARVGVTNFQEKKN